MTAQQLQSLLTASLSGDEKAYSEFLTLISRRLRGFIAKRIAAAEVEDVLQEILISLHKARHTYDGKRPALPWVIAIARFRLTDHLRKHYAGRKHLQVDISDFENILHDDVTESSETSESVSEEVRVITRAAAENFAFTTHRRTHGKRSRHTTGDE